MLEGALNSLVTRHESLRTTFPNLDGRPVQKINTATPLPLPVVEVNGGPERLDTLMSEEMHCGFDLARGPLFRAMLYRLGPEDHVLLLLQHHIISDAWSLDLMMRELGILYDDAVNGRASTLPDLRVQYRDYSRWLREWMQGEPLNRQLEYWRSHLVGGAAGAGLANRSATAGNGVASGSQLLVCHYTRGERRTCNSLSQRGNYAVHRFYWWRLTFWLLRYAGQEDLLVGVPIANRDSREIEGLIGLFVNTLVVRNDLSGDPTVKELLARVRERCLDAYAHQELRD